MLTDPTAYEEEMCGGIGSNLVVCWNKGLFCGLQKYGGNNLSPESETETIKIAKRRSKLIEKVIDSCIKNDNVKIN